MDQHALAILGKEKLRKWPITRRIQESGLQVLESQKFGGGVLNQFWDQLGSCRPNLKENTHLQAAVESLQEEILESAEKTFEVLFRGLTPEDVEYDLVLRVAAEYFTHLGVAFMNPGRLRSGAGSEFSVSEVIGKETDELLRSVNEEEGFGKRRQGALKALRTSFQIPYTERFA
ncbi:hypothetical protein BJV74DRAFT_792373 [Russula compacta]|nr:hypothetical protein BJV74DRAFT_792373 [Russula compacta]